MRGKFLANFCLSEITKGVLDIQTSHKNCFLKKKRKKKKENNSGCRLKLAFCFCFFGNVHAEWEFDEDLSIMSRKLLVIYLLYTLTWCLSEKEGGEIIL